MSAAAVLAWSVMAAAAAAAATEQLIEFGGGRRSRCGRGTHGVVGDGGGGVEDALAALHGAADGVEVQEVGLAEDEPLGGAVQRLEVLVLRVICMPSPSTTIQRTQRR